VSIPRVVGFVIGGRENMGSEPLSREEVLQVMKRLKRTVAKAKLNHMTMREIFTHFDQDGSGDIDEREFTTGLNRLGFDLSRDEVRLLMQQFPGGKSGHVSYRQFINTLGLGTGAGDGTDGGVGQDLAAIEEIIERELGKAIRRGDGRLRHRHLFDEADRAGSGRLSRRAFQRVVEDTGFDFTGPEFRRILEVFDPNEDGSVVYRGFLTVLDKVLDRLDSELVEHLVTAFDKADIRDARSLRQLEQTFARFDRHDEGVIRLAELRRALDEHAIRLSDDELQKTVDRFDRPAGDKAGSAAGFNYRDMIRLCEEALETARVRHEVMETVSQQIRRLEQAKGLALKVKNLFRRKSAGDRHGDDDFRMSQADLVQAFEDAEIGLDRATVRRMFDLLDPKRTGKVAATKARKFVESALNQGRLNLSPVVADLRPQLQRLVDEGTDVWDAFERLDAHGTMKELDSRGVERCLSRLGVDLSIAQIDSLAAEFPGSLRGTVNYAAMLRALALRPPQNLDVLRLADEVRMELRRIMGKRTASRLRLREEFEAMDRDGNGYLERGEFRRELDRLGFDCPPTVVSQLLQKFDLNGDGRISYREFVRFAEGDVSDVTLDDEMTRLRRLVQDARKTGIDLLQSFDHFDRNRSGDIDVDEFQQGMQRLGIEVSLSEARRLMERFPGGRHGHIRYKDFVRGIEAKEYGTGRGGAAGRDSGALVASEEGDGFETDLRAEIERARGDPHDMLRLLRRRFEAVDRRGRGVVEQMDFEDVLVGARIQLPGVARKSLLRRLDRGGSGRIRYADFLELVERLTQARGRSDRTQDGAGRSGSSALDPELRVVHETMQQAVDEGKDLWSACERLDGEGRGELSMRDLEDAVGRCGVRLTRGDWSLVADKFMGTNEHWVSYEAMLRGLRLRRTAALGGIGALRRTVRDQAEDCCSPAEFKDCFVGMDKAERGWLSRSDFRRGLRKLGMRIDVADLRALMSAFDPEVGGRVDYLNFIAFVLDGRTPTAQQHHRTEGNWDVGHGRSSLQSDPGALVGGTAMRFLRQTVQRAVDRGEDLWAAFEKFDSLGKGEVEGDDAVRALGALDIDMDRQMEADTLDLMQREFPGNRRGRVRYNDLIAALKLEGLAVRMTTAVTDRVVKEVRLAGAFDGGQRSSTLFRKFSDVDLAGRGWVSRADARAALLDAGLDLEKQTQSHLLRAFDQDGNGRFHYEDFLDLLSSEVGRSGAGLRESGRDLEGTRRSFDRPPQRTGRYF